jgi:hypothetical protein
MVLCEYQFENLNALGDDAYLDDFAQRLDDLCAAGWAVPNSSKDAAFRGWWQI